ncbi:polysaccharide deacetylase family protein [Limisphaera sp. VF-2]|uniref:polysaccharide deacetylase family protein n=1 Tax=Limisphaera sp. VF-2 TaxID=3400418 RepID=UPI003C2327FC
MLRRFLKLILSAALNCADRAQDAVRLSRHDSPRGVVLYYHAVPARYRRSFAGQLDLLCQHAQPWALDGSTPIAGFWAGISFDDAYVSVLENAVPELVARKLPFTVFVPTGSLGRRPSWVQSPAHPFWQEQVMSAEQLAALARLPGATLGSHTVNHPRLTQLTREALECELRDSKYALEDILGRPVTLLSFPHGVWNPAVVECARAVGYTRLFGIEPVCLDGGVLPEVIGRVAVEPHDLRCEFVLKLRGCYRWAAAGRRGPGRSWGPARSLVRSAHND